jgi:hypothetical protein
VNGTRFEFGFDPRYRLVLRLLTITPARSWVEIDDETFEARFGPWRLRTTVDNISCAEITGPYRALRAIGPHISLVDRGLSFGTRTEGGVCVLFHEAVRSRATLGIIRHPGLTVTVADPDGLVTAIGGAGDARPGAN